VFDQVKWDRRFLYLAKEISMWSKDPSTRVGALITDSVGRMVGSGYNGFPRGVVDLDERYLDRETKYKFIVHAEVNACLLAGDQAKGCSIYVYPTIGFPPTCNECAKVVIQSGIKRVVGFSLSPEDKSLHKLNADKWRRAAEISEQMYKEAGVKLVEVPV
jgi:dCMP deaminase